jgi:RyR domain-containing protein
MSAAKSMSREERIETVARCCHEANRAWCEAHGDETQKPWGDAQGWQRESACQGVQVALDGATPEEQHESWCRAKLDAGWRYGEVKDAEAKTHPYLVSYDQLPQMQRVKDSLFGAVVRALAPALGLEREGVAS